MGAADTSPHLTGKSGVSKAVAPCVLSVHVRAQRRLGLSIGGSLNIPQGVWLLFPLRADTPRHPSLDEGSPFSPL